MLVVCQKHDADCDMTFNDIILIGLIVSSPLTTTTTSTYLSTKSDFFPDADNPLVISHRFNAITLEEPTSFNGKLLPGTSFS